MRRRLKKYRGLVDAGRMTVVDVQRSYESWRSHAEHGDTHRLLQNMDSLYFSLFPELKTERSRKQCPKP
jgi:hypothetical protein